MATPATSGPGNGVLGNIDWQALNTEPRRDTIRELHGYRGPSGAWGGGADGPCWPEPYHRCFASAAYLAELDRPVRQGATQLWEHGSLLQVTSREVLDTLRARWGERRTRGATVAALTVPDVTTRDRALMRAFCTKRGWQRVLVQMFEHVGCKAAWTGMLDDRLREYGAVGRAVLAARQRPRIAVLEEFVVEAGDDTIAVLGQIDQLDRTLDKLGMGESWWMNQVPDNSNDLKPFRNLFRMADKQGMIFRSLAERDFGAENSYCPEMTILCIDPEIYASGIANHDIFHFVVPVLIGDDRLAFEVGNNGLEGDGQFYNNLIFIHRHSGPEYEGHGAWAEPHIFEVLERAFGVASFPEAVIAGRTMSVVIHEQFEAEPVAILEQMIPTLHEGDREVLREVLAYFVNHIQRDHGFLRRLWPRYSTPVFPQWREQYGALRCVDTLQELCKGANDALWRIEDIDLETFDHPLRGRISENLIRSEYLGFKLIELRHLLTLTREADPAHRSRGDELFRRVQMLWEELRKPAAAAIDQIPPAERDHGLLARLERQTVELEAQQAAFKDDLRRFSGDIRAHQRSWSDPIMEVREGFVDGWLELFQDFLQDNHYYAHPLHDGEDKIIEIEHDDGTRELLKSNRSALGASLKYPQLEEAASRR